MKPHPMSFRFLLKFCCIFTFWTLPPIRCSATESEISAHHYVRRKHVDPSYAGNGASTRIHGGFEAPEGKFKFMILALISRTRNLRDQTIICSGSLVDEKWVLTAAHCIKPTLKLPSIIVVGGKANLKTYYKQRILVPFAESVNEKKLGVQERRVVAIHINPWYCEKSNYNDLALLELDKPFQLGENVETIALSKEKMNAQMSCVVVGWGLSDSQMQTFSLMFAQDVYAQTTEISCSYKKSGPLLCLEEGGPGICKGDSGSPLVCNGTTWGVASFSLSTLRNPKCGDEQEEYYAELLPHLSWLERTMQRNKGKAISSSTLFIMGLQLLLLRTFFMHVLY